MKRSILYVAIFVSSMAAGIFLENRVADAYIFHGTGQKDNYNVVSGYYMHQWLIHEYDYCAPCAPVYYDHWYRNGMDSRWSWGGSGRSMHALAMIPARAWVCGAQYWYRDVYLYQTYYHYADSGHTGWTTCGAQADFRARFYQPGVVDSWPYLNY